MNSELGGSRARLAKDVFARRLGIELVEMKPGYARATMKVTPDMLNGVGLTHGGAVFTLADLAFAAACNAHGPESLALHANISYLKATTSGAVLTAVCREENQTRKTGLYRMEVHDEGGNLIALAQGISYRPGTGGSR